MFSKIFKQMFRHKLLTGIILLLIIAGGYFGYQRLFGEKNTVQYVTAAVEKGTLIVSVSGSGQVTVLDQVDIKPKVSGDITTFYISQDQEVKKGQILAVLDTGNAKKAIRDAEIALEGAKIKLEELLAPPDAQSLLQAENALAQAERDLEKAKKNYENIEADAESTLASAYEDGYNDVSTAFFKLSDYMKDLRDVLGTAKNEQEYINSYKVLLGSDSLFIQKLLDDYYQAADLYDKNFTFFRGVFRDSNRDTVYRLISDTLETTKAISQALESSRHMYDAIVVQSYARYTIASTIDKMQPRIESDLSSIFSNISSLQKTIDTVDGTVSDTPDKIKDAKLAFESAKEKLEERKLSLEELKAGADPLDIRTQQNTVAQKEDALSDAKEKLAECFIHAPFDGIIGEVNSKIKKGDSVSAGTTLAPLITKQKIAEITLNEIDVAKVKKGQKVTITFDAIENLTITGEVTEIDILATVSQGVVTYGVKIVFDTQDEQVKPGMSVSATIITDAKQNVLLAPNSAVKYQNNAQYVEVMTNNNIPQSQAVEIGLSNDTMTEIISGLQEKDKVVTQTISPTKAQTTQTQGNQGFRIPGMGGSR